MLRLLNRLLSRPRAAGAVPPRVGPELETMEPRLLYSADLMPAGLDATAPSAEIRLLDSTPIIDAATEAAQTHRQEIVFIDAGIDNAEQLLDALDRDRSALQVIWLDRNTNGIDQISAALAGRSDIGAIHIISHGASGQLILGNSTVDSATLTQRGDTISGWAKSLTDDADILIYGCNVAGDAEGLIFIESLARLSGADVAASDDLTGAGGDWVLERRVGAIDSLTLSSMRWQGTLGVTASSADIDVNTVTLGEQEDVAVAMLNDGRWIATWTNDTIKKVYGQIFNADGSKQGSSFQISATFSGSQSQSAVATDGTDHIVFVFTSDKDGNDDIYARIFNIANNTQTGDIKINEGSTAGDQSNASVAMNSSGDFVVSWEGQGSGDNDGIFMRRFDVTGTPSTSITAVNTDTSKKQEESDIALSNDGRVVVTWFDDSNGKRIVARQFDALNNGSAQILMPDGHPNDPDTPAVAMDDAGNFVVVWHEDGNNGSNEDIYMQSFTAAGSPIGTVVQVNTTTSNAQKNADLAINAAGYTIVTWQSLNQDGSAEGIFARSYEPGASNPSAEIGVNLYTDASQAQPAVAINSLGQIVIAWEGARANDPIAINARTFDWPEASTANTAPVLTPVAPNLVTINEDAGPPSGATGTLISTLLSLTGSGSGPQNVTDPDVSDTVGLALMAADDSNGNWYYSVNGGSNWTIINSAALSSSNALLLAADSQTRIAFAPNANFNTATGSQPSLDFRAWDRSSGSNGSLADTTSNGGSSAFSINTDTALLSVNAVNDPPAITTNLLVISEGQTVVLSPAMLAGADVEDPPGGLLYSVISVTGGFFARTTSPTVAAASFTQQEVIDGQIQFVHNGGEAAPTYTLTLTDSEDLSSAPSAANIAFTNVNDAPVLADAPLSFSILQNNGAPVGAVGVRVTTLVSMAGSGSGPQNVTDPDAGAVAGIAITAADSTHGMWHYSIDNGVTWNMLDLAALPAGEARLLAANGNTRLYFHHTDTATGSFANSLSFHAWDGSTGTNGGGANPLPGGGSTAFSTATDTVDLIITAVNQAPTLNTGIAVTVIATEDAPSPVGAVGFTPSALVSFAGSGSGPQNVTDTDPGALLGIALTGADTSGGNWWYSTNGGNNWTLVPGGLSNTNALLLADNGLNRLYFQSTVANAFGTTADALTFKAWDQTFGNDGQTSVDTTANNAFSTASHTATLDLQAVNDIPLVTANTLSISEGATVVLGAANLSASDDDTPPPASLSYTVQTVSGGIFAWVSTPGVAITSFTQADINANLVQFEHDGNESPPSYTLSLTDGTATVSPINGSITFTPVNDAPILTVTGNATLSLDEDSGLPVGEVGIPIEAMIGLASAGTGPRNVTDPDAGGVLGIAVISVDTTNGNWFITTNKGSNWSALGSVSSTSGLLLLADGNTRLAFQPNANYTGTTSSALRFVAWDTSAGTAGALADTTSGTAFSAANDTLTLIVRPVNDAPTVTAIDLGNIAEDGTRLITQAHLKAGASDLDGDTLTALDLTLTNGNGVLTDNGDGTWTFTPTADWSGPVSFSFNVDDGTTATANTATLVVDAVNDMPDIGLNQLTLNEGDTIVLGSSQLVGSDADHADSAIVYTVSGLSNGYFALASAPTTPVTQFTHAQVASSQVRFVHNGGEAAPTYTLTLSDGTLSSPPSAANIAFTNVNDTPSISAIAGQVITAGGGFGPLNFTIADAETSAAALTVTARSSNPSVLPDSAIVLSGSGASRSVSVVAGHSGGYGSANLIIDVSDGSSVTSLPVAVSAPAPATTPSGPIESPLAEKSTLPPTPVAEATTDAVAEAAPAEASPALADIAAPAPTVLTLIDASPAAAPTAPAPPPQATNDAADRIEITVTNITPLRISLSTADVLALLYTPSDVASTLSTDGQISTALREARLEQAFDQLRDNADGEAQGEQQGIGATMVTGAGLTIGYVAWLIRGGVLLTSLLSTMPAWRLLDPLPILNSAAGKRRGDDDDSLEAMVDQGPDDSDDTEPVRQPLWTETQP